MKPWSAMTSQERATAEQLFDAMLVRDALAEADETATPARPVGIEDLYHFAWSMLPGARHDEVAAAIRRDARVAALFDEVLAETARFALPAAAAADTGETGSREIQGVRIRWQDSSVEPDQTYVLISVTHAQASFPSVLIARRSEGEAIVERLPEPVGGTARLVYQRDAPLVAALKDWRTRIYLG